MPRQARIGDSGSHGGVIITGSPDLIVDGSPCARITDIYACPIHGPNPIVQGAPYSLANGLLMARIGDHTACGAVIISGSETQITE